MATAVKIALDWLPNGNHVAFFVAKGKGLYADQGIDVTFISPHSDNYESTPASRLESGEALLAITPSETVISYNTRPPSMPKPPIKALATLLAEDDSRIVTLKSSGIDRPAKLEGKRYASYGARYEGRIVQQMIKNDGGSGDYQELALPMLGLWETVLKGKADATWIFKAWEGQEAKLKGIELNEFKLGDYGISYGYSPVVVATVEAIHVHGDTVGKILRATATAFQFVQSNAEEAASIMYTQVATDFPDHPIDSELLTQSVKAVVEANKNSSWGRMDAKRWDAFLDWLADNGLLTSKVQSRGASGADTTSLDGLRSGDVGDIIPRNHIKSSDLFTNDFLL